MPSRFAGVAMLLGSLLVPAVAHSAVFVCGPADPGCLIASIAKSNVNGPAHDVIVLQGGDYVLDRVDNQDLSDSGTGLPVVHGALTILGTGQDRTVVLRDPTAVLFRVLDVGPTGTLILAFLTLQGGEVDLQLNRGGCLRLQEGSTAVLFHSTVRECGAFVGGGIDSFGTLTLIRTTVTANFAEFFAGALGAFGPLTRILDGSWIGENVASAAAGIGVDDTRGRVVMQDSVLTEGTATLTGGGGVGGPGLIVMERMLISENFGGLRAGAIDLLGGDVVVRHSTFVHNGTVVFGGGIYVRDGHLLLDSTSLFQNEASPVFGRGGGIYNENGTVTLRNSTLLDNQAAFNPECFGQLLLQGFNVVGDPTRFVQPGENPCQP